jgi:dihydrofolate reductase
MSMAKLCVRNFSMSLDGYGAGPDQNLQQPMGIGGMALHEWFLKTPTFQQMHPQIADKVGASADGAAVVDDRFAARGFENVGAWILGRNMFGPVRGPWPDESWKGWWGDEPPYHVPVFVLTHHARTPLAMQGATTFYFVTEGIEAALERAMEAAGGKDVRLGGGAATIRQYLRAGLVDEMHLAVSPVLLGTGENLLGGIHLPKLGYACTEHAAGEGATHYVIDRRG